VKPKELKDFKEIDNKFKEIREGKEGFTIK